MLSTLAIANYRSLRDLVLPLGQLNVVTGPNGSGKSSLYRAIRLLAEAARGGAVAALAKEGGLVSTLWAGPEKISRAVQSGEHPIEGTTRNKVVNLRMGFASVESYSFLIDFGIPRPPGVPTYFLSDPEIKHELLWHGATRRPSTLIVERRGPVVRYCQEERIVSHNIQAGDSMLLQVADPASAPELLVLREEMRAWRFYDQFRTDAMAPARQTQIGTRTNILASDGADLAAAIQTIEEVGDNEGLARAIDDAFPQSRVFIRRDEDARFTLQMQQKGIIRPLGAAELSDGTLRFLLLVAALLTPRPPALLVLNEPEASLHPDLLPALARLIRQASKHSQMIVVSHSTRLLRELSGTEGCNEIVLEKMMGETQVAGQTRLGRPPWQWPNR